MKQLADVVLKVANKYMQDIDLIIDENKLTLNYFKNKNNQEIYKTLEIEQFEDKLKIIIKPEKIVKVTDLKGFEDIIEILSKQCSAKEHTKEEIEQIKRKYKAGQKVELIKMYDLQAVPTKTRGIIDYIDDLGTLHIVWENKSTLGLVVGVDEFKIICPLCNQELRCLDNANE